SPTYGGFNTPDEFGTLEMAASASAAGRKDSLAPIIALNFEEPITNNASQLSTGSGVNGVRASAKLQQMGDGKPWNASCQGAGKSGRGCVFDATAKRYVTVQVPEAFGLARGDFTAMLWLKTASDDSQCLLGSTTSPPFWILAINKIGGKRLLRFLMGTGPPTTVVNADAPPADDRWHHVAVTVDRGKLATLFCDGEILSATDISHHKGALKNLLTIGGPYNSFSGCVDNVQVYRGALSPTDIKAIYQRQQSGNGGFGK
ncbi:MAG: LamG domain-containing protein, partial [Verrucomicrobia bacterium]|nr:LamG domain-containing protein [Verrucomicrobiota bacterium]